MSADDRERLREQLAALAHAQWSGWMAFMLARFQPHHEADGTERWDVGATDARRWRRQMQTPYADLSEAEKESDRTEADRVLALLPPSERDAPMAALVAEYADLLAGRGVWVRSPYHPAPGQQLIFEQGARATLLLVAARLGVTDLHERAAEVVARGESEENAGDDSPS